MKIYLIRHGKTSANEKSLYYGFTDLELCDDGRTELLEIAENYKNIKIDKYFTSGMLRANQSLEILFGNVDFTVVEDLKEINFGDFEMKSYEDLKENHEYINWLNDFENYKIPNGESFVEFKSRVILSFEQVVSSCERNNCESVVMVVHNGVISTIMDYYFKGDKSFFDWKSENGKGYIFIKKEENYWEKLL